MPVVVDDASTVLSNHRVSAGGGDRRAGLRLQHPQEVVDAVERSRVTNAASRLPFSPTSIGTVGFPSATA